MNNEQNLDLSSFDVEIILGAVELCLDISEVPPHWKPAAVTLKAKLENQTGPITRDETELMMNSLYLFKSLTNKRKAVAKKGSKEFKEVRSVLSGLNRVIKILNIRISQANNESS